MLTLALVAAALLFVVMSVVWWIAIRIQNAGIVDIAWSANFSLVVSFYALVSDGYALRRLVLAAMVVLWSARLAIYLYRRVMGHHPCEDGRYQELRKEWVPHVDARFFGFFQLQGILNVILSVPFLIACANPSAELGIAEGAGAALWAIGLLGESTADLQLDRFRRDPANKGRTCQVGLWRYSRHPNYFFEWMIWVGYFVFALGSPWGWLSIYCPSLMLYFLLRVTGIPMTEEQALKSRGGEYREYQRTTSMFVPWFRKG